MIRVLTLADEAATLALGHRLAPALDPPQVVYLKGDLGAGKTTLARGILRALGHAGPVKSPTYTLVESYDLERLTVHHLDLYRLGDPSELEALGIRDLLDPTALLLVEWPERGEGWLPPADVEVQLSHVAKGRSARIRAHSPRGRALMGLLTPVSQRTS
ncbi:MAG TPA: tRNA (adenosine(37)-N6)-threonylcarbamoyltransferase complex ATPase subunit type 1 TsaE [Xanthomonadaceae bacterium]|nr:tRNA (adenosine(37)-N6)-threonylcarbamoyltransferase complex ATPase subunit type 1 TsaE [Xanthomonadaceae bacterium]